MSNLKMNNFRARKLVAMLLLASPLGALAVDSPSADSAAVAFRLALSQHYPNTKFGDIHRSPVPGIWEVWMGANVAYVADEGRHFIFGHLYDMQTQTDLTAAKKEQAGVTQEAAGTKIGFADLPLQDAIKTVRGSGERKLAVFADPDCRYCRELEEQLAKLDNVTIYTFMYPIESLHPEASSISQSIWCAKDRSAAWKTYMSKGKAPKSARCDSPLQRNVDLATKAGINGTPFIFFGNGDKAAGMLDVASLKRRLDGK